MKEISLWEWVKSNYHSSDAQFNELSSFLSEDPHRLKEKIEGAQMAKSDIRNFPLKWFGDISYWI